MQLHELIRKTREETGTKIKDMVEIFGCTYREYKKIEAGELSPRRSKLLRMAEHFSIDKDSIDSLYQKSKERKDSIHCINFQHISAIQKAVQSAFLTKLSPINVHSHMIPLYWDYYKYMGEKTFQTLALEHTVACIKSNYDYNAMIPLFTEISASVGYDSFKNFLSHICPSPSPKKVKPTYNRILSIFGKGHACKQNGNLTKGECAKDAIQKIENREKGRHCYSLQYNNIIKTIYLIIDETNASMQDNEGVEYVFVAD